MKKVRLLCLLLVAFINVTITVAVAEPAFLWAIGDGEYHVYVNGHLVALRHDLSRPLQVSVSLDESDLIAVKFKPRTGSGPHDGFFLLAYSKDKKLLFTTGAHWFATDQILPDWNTNFDFGPPWEGVGVIHESRYDILTKNFPASKVISAPKGNIHFLKAVVHWREGDPQFLMPGWWDGWSIEEEQRRMDYFSADNLTSQDYQIWFKGQFQPLKALSKKELIWARNDLERLWESPKFGKIPGGDTSIRKMLRVLRYAIGPNLNEQKSCDP